MSELRYQVVDRLPAGTTPSTLVVLCHGYGAPGDDLVPIGDELFTAYPDLAPHVRFVFPEAPLAPREFAPFGGRAWWELSVSQFIQALESGQLREVARHQPVGMNEASEQLNRLVERLLGELKLEPAQLVLGGFSQGSMVATDVALRMPTAPAGLIVMSGTLLCEDEWSRLAKHRGAMPVLQSHGSYDPILPMIGGVWLHEMFRDAGLDAKFLQFAGPHTIPREMLDEVAKLLLQQSSDVD